MVACFLAILSTYSLSGQNLVPNPSLEIPNLDSCPRDYSQLQKAIPWYSPTTSTPDLFNECNPIENWVGVPQNYLGYQYPSSGDGYAGFAVYNTQNVREYVQVKLLDKLLHKTKYYLSFYVSLSDSSRYATDDIGAYFSKEKITGIIYYDNDTLAYTPQISNPEGNTLTDKINWVEIKGSYTASGGESYLTIGNFKADIYTDTLFMFDGGKSSNSDYKCYYYIDDICLSSNPNECDGIVNINIVTEKKNLKIKYDRNNIIINLINIQNENNKIVVYNSLGNRIKTIEINNENTTIDTQDLQQGMYIIHLLQNNTIIYSHKFVTF